MFRGVLTALITPFCDGVIDEDAFVRLINWQIECGVHGLVPCGTTGESPTLTHDEHKHLVALCVEVVAGRVPVVAGTGSNATEEAIIFTRHAESVGADGALIVTPYYNKPPQAGLLAHYRALNDAVDKLPLIIYNIPNRCVIDMDIKTMGMLARLTNIIGVKDATADIDRVRLQAQACGSDFIQLSGEDMTELAFMRAGGHGCISVASNIVPDKCAAIQNAALTDAFEQAEAIAALLQPLYTALSLECNPIAIKYAMARLGFGDGSVRLPLVAPSAATQRAIDGALCELSII